jgi:hypothetical protein
VVWKSQPSAVPGTIAVPCWEKLPLEFWLAWMVVLPLAVKLELVARKLAVSVSLELPVVVDDVVKWPELPPPA